jgi:hypothetical protein
MRTDKEIKHIFTTEWNSGEFFEILVVNSTLNYLNSFEEHIDFVVAVGLHSDRSKNTRGKFFFAKSDQSKQMRDAFQNILQNYALLGSDKSGRGFWHKMRLRFIGEAIRFELADIIIWIRGENLGGFLGIETNLRELLIPIEITLTSWLL